MIVYTAGQQDYADLILDRLDPTNELFARRLYRQHCMLVNDQFYVKDLDLIGGREMKNMIIIDNSIFSFAFQIDNGFPIESYYGCNPDDIELPRLLTFLTHPEYNMINVSDVREVIKEKFKLT